MMIGKFFLVLLDLPIELVGERINGRVQIGGLRFSMNGLAGRAMHRGFRFLEKLFHAERDGDVVQMFEVADDALQLAGHVIVQCAGDGDLMTTDGDLHNDLLKLIL